MNVARAEVIPYALPFREPYVTARGRLDRRELILLRLTDADGVVGLGETTSLSLRGGRGIAEIARELEAACESLIAGTFAEPRSPEARCAYKTAREDLGMRARGNFANAPPVLCNATLSTGSPEDVAESALAWQEHGFGVFKLKVGGGDDDVGQVRAVREALGPEARIRVDANGAWDVSRASAVLGELEPLDVELCEQPVGTFEDMAVVRQATSIPIAADESVVTAADAVRARELGACDLLTIKLAKVGGPTVAAEDWGLPVFLSSALDGPVGIAAAAATVQMLPRPARIAHGLATQYLFAETIASVGPAVLDGMLHLPEGPGLGVEIDEDALARHRL